MHRIPTARLLSSAEALTGYCMNALHVCGDDVPPWFEQVESKLWTIRAELHRRNA